MVDGGSDFLIVMCKAPDGRAKTRLAPRLDPGQRAALVEAMLEDLLETTGRVPSLQPILACASWPVPPAMELLAGKVGAVCWPQVEGDLGARLVGALDAACRWCDTKRWDTRADEGSSEHPPDRILFVGSDSPTLPPALLELALTALETHPIVLGPAFDGGYYLLGVRALEARRPEIRAALFEDIPWSEQGVLEATVHRVSEAGLRVHLLPFWYDVDSPEDLGRLLHHGRALATLSPNEDPPGARTVRLVRGWLEPVGFAGR